MTRKILVVGGSGIFGARLADGILATSDLDMVVAGRDRDRCEAFVAAHDDAGRAHLSVQIVDTGTVTVGDLIATGAFILVDAAQPLPGVGCPPT